MMKLNLSWNHGSVIMTNGIMISNLESRITGVRKLSSCNVTDAKAMSLTTLLTLIFFDVEKNIRCSHCKKFSPSHQWNCKCGINWFICDKHRWCTRNVANTKNKESQKSDQELTKSNKKQKIGIESIPEIMASHQELLKEDLVNEEIRLSLIHI